MSDSGTRNRDRLLRLNWALCRSPAASSGEEKKQAMNPLYWLGAVVTFCWRPTSSSRCSAESSEMSANGYLQLAFYLVVLTALAKPLGLHGPGLRGRPCGLDACWAAASARLPPLRHPRREDMAGDLRRPCWRSLRRSWPSISCNGCRGAALESRAPAGDDGSLPSTPPSASRPTQLQSYGGETTLSYFTQMLA